MLPFETTMHDCHCPTSIDDDNPTSKVDVLQGSLNNILCMTNSINLLLQILGVSRQHPTCTPIQWSVLIRSRVLHFLSLQQTRPKSTSIIKRHRPVNQFVGHGHRLVLLVVGDVVGTVPRGSYTLALCCSCSHGCHR